MVWLKGNGMVERFNCSLLQLLLVYVEKEQEWERYLPLVLFAYRTVTHTFTGVSPFMLMFRRQPNRFCDFSHPCLFDPGTYQAQLQAKLAQLHALVETNSPKLATPKRPDSTPPSFKDGDLVWLSVPTAGTLQPRWEGNCRIKTVKSLITWKSQMTKLTRYQTSPRKLKSCRLSPL